MTLVERLRAQQVIEAYVTFEKLHALRHEAADRIEALEKEIESLREDLDHYKTLWEDPYKD